MAINLQEKKAAKAGKKYVMSAAIIADIKTFDKWIVREILDYVEDKETNNPDPIVTPEEIIADIKEETPPPATETPAPATEPIVEADPSGLKCDAEFEEMIKTGKTDVTFEEMKNLCPTAEKLIFDDYVKDGSDNGLSTTYFLCKEYEPNKFKLVKK